jgi:hypothetical protein
VIKSRWRWVLHVACIGERKGAYTVLVGRPEGKSPLERPRRIWEDNIKMDLQKTG